MSNAEWASVACSHGFSAHSSGGWNSHRHRVGDQRYYRARNNDPDADPNPHDQRVQMHLNDWLSRLRILAFINYVQIFLRRRAVGDHRRSLLARFVETALGVERRNLLSAFENVHDRPLAAIIRIVILSVRLADERVSADCHLVAEAHLLLFVLIEDGAGEPDHNDDHAEVNDVSAVAAGVAMCGVDPSGEKSFGA